MGAILFKTQRGRHMTSMLVGDATLVYNQYVPLVHPRAIDGEECKFRFSGAQIKCYWVFNMCFFLMRMMALRSAVVPRDASL